jgi:hypothetical protein
VHGDESPVGDHTGDANATISILAGDEVLHSGGIEL